MRGYTGRRLNLKAIEEEKQLFERAAASKEFMTGFTGFQPGQQGIVGESKYTSANRTINDDTMVESTEGMETNEYIHDEDDARLTFQDIDLEDRYEMAIANIVRLKQSQDVLIKIVSSKMTERTNSYAQQNIFLHNLLSSFDTSHSGYMTEKELRVCLEASNVQFSDDQFIALFAYFDDGCTGRIDWRVFAQRIMVPNPRGGLGIMTKSITSNA